jgi:hypothetical protein
MRNETEPIDDESPSGTTTALERIVAPERSGGSISEQAKHPGKARPFSGDYSNASDIIIIVNKIANITYVSPSSNVSSL